jgi:hypothetical protein
MKNLIVIFALFIVCLLTACEQMSETISDEQEELSTNNVDELFEQNEYNLDLMNFALAVGNAMNKSEDFRKLIKQEALFKFDGDYNVLLSHILDKPVKYDNAQLRSNSGNTVKDLLDDYYFSQDSVQSSTGFRVSFSSTVSSLSIKYPYLQVSVPVNAEAWDTSVTPVVAFVPSEYKDGVTQSVAGYNLNGSAVIVDAINPPAEPMVVVKENEWKLINDKCPEIPVANDTTVYVPATPTKLIASTTFDGVLLTWEIPDPAHVIGYYIYRKGPSDTKFEQILVNNGASNTACFDITAKAGQIYLYYVKSYARWAESGHSFTVSATGTQPANLTVFNAEVLTDKQVELRWNVENRNYQKIQLFRQVVGNNADYQLYKEFGQDVYDYFDNNMNVLAGKKIQYKSQTVSSSGSQSSPQYDFVYMPYRNPAYSSPVKIKRIECSGNLEGWLMGTPEILVTVFGVDGESRTREIVSLLFDMDGYEQNYDQRLLDWQPHNWYDRYTFHVTEEDPGSDKGIDITANISVKQKVGSVMDIDAKAGITKTFKFSSPENCGSADLTYFDPVNIMLIFQKDDYHCNITLGE